MGDVMLPPRLVVLVWIVGIFASAGSVDAQDAAGSSAVGADAPDLVDPNCTFPTAPETALEGQGLVLRVWHFPWDDLYARPTLPVDAAFHTYRAVVRAAGAEELYPPLEVPGGVDGTEADVWRDEAFNNDLAYSGVAGAIDRITCLDALIFAQQNARVPQIERPTEFLASILRRRSEGREEVAVVFGAGDELLPPNSVYGLDIVDDHLAGRGRNGCPADDGWERQQTRVCGVVVQEAGFRA